MVKVSEGGIRTRQAAPSHSVCPHASGVLQRDVFRYGETEICAGCLAFPSTSISATLHVLFARNPPHKYCVPESPQAPNLMDDVCRESVIMLASSNVPMPCQKSWTYL